MTPEDHASFVALLPALGTEADASAVADFVRTRREACHDALGAVPGHDGVRAGLLRALELVADPSEHDRLLDAADAALEAYDPAAAGRLGALRRHPSWVALAALELAERRGEDGLVRATALAARGFAATAGSTAQGRGEVLWAVAETASEVGWDDRVDALLAAAASGPFADEASAGRVALLQVLRMAEADDPRTDEAVDQLLAMDELDLQTQVHALWIGGQRDRVGGRIGRAVERFEAALELVGSDEKDVRARIEGTLEALGARGDGAEA